MIADLDRVSVVCDGTQVAGHERVWAWHQTISDPEHVAAAKALRRARIGLIRPAPEPEVETRRLVDYDAAFGITSDQGPVAS